MSGTTANDILALMTQEKITLKNLIDAHIENQGIIGVGLITLEQQLIAIVHAHHKRVHS